MEGTLRRSDTRSIRLNRKAVTFLICLVISAFSWLMISLTEISRQPYMVKVTYRNLPEGVPASTLPDSLKVTLSASGFNLLFYEPPSKGVILDCSNPVPGKNSRESYILTVRREKDLGIQFGGEVDLARIEPDTLYLRSFGGASRQVAVRFAGTLQLADGFMLRDSFRLNPGSVTIMGEDSVISKVVFVETEKKNILAGEKAFSVPILLIAPGDGIALSQDSVRVTGIPEKVSSSEFMVPVTIINLPEGYTFKSVPREVKVRALVPFSSLKTFDRTDVEAYVDYRDIRDQGSTQAKVNVRSRSRVSYQLKVIPPTVEFILRQKGNE